MFVFFGSMRFFFVVGSVQRRFALSLRENSARASLCCSSYASFIRYICEKILMRISISRANSE